MSIKKELPYQYNFIGLYGDEKTVTIHADSLSNANELFEQRFPYATEVEVLNDLS